MNVKYQSLNQTIKVIVFERKIEFKFMSACNYNESNQQFTDQQRKQHIFLAKICQHILQ